MTNGVGAVLGSSISGQVIEHFFTAPDGALQWHGIWLGFAGYALVVAVLFVPLFRHRHDRGATVPAHGAADVGNP
jgi:NHS family xanthosine MFS transporter